MVLRYCVHKNGMVKLKIQSYTVCIHILSSQIEVISSKHEHLKPDNLTSKDYGDGAIHSDFKKFKTVFQVQ